MKGWGLDDDANIFSQNHYKTHSPRKFYRVCCVLHLRAAKTGECVMRDNK